MFLKYFNTTKRLTAGSLIMFGLWWIGFFYCLVMTYQME
jgi:hypothetical protein